ncbi:TPA: FAD/NAD(P)-binding protein [Staphylococcus aureus]|nr:FAD/NAD(P)-binding protein [Staphylococcus aureus]
MIILNKRISIIGSGPRGLSVLERLVCRCNDKVITDQIEINLIDDSFVGAGRVWSPIQSKHLLMNTYAKEITAFSGTIKNNQKERAGSGLTFYQWWIKNYNDFDYYEGYAPRKYYGEYLLYVLSTIEKSLPENIILNKINDEVTDIKIEKKK